MGKGRNPQSQITVLKAIVQATGDSLGARVSETLGYQKIQGKGEKEISICQHNMYIPNNIFIYIILYVYDKCYVPETYTVAITQFGGDINEVLDSKKKKQHTISTKA